MAVEFKFKHDVQDVYETLTDPQFLVDRCLALGELSAECDVEEDDEGITVNLVREIKRELPKALAKIFGSVQVTEMKESWVPCEGGWCGDWTMTVRGQPVTVSAEFELVKTQGGCCYTVSHSAKAKIPLVGKTVEKFILSQTSGGATDELAYLRDYLG